MESIFQLSGFCLAIGIQVVLALPVVLYNKWKKVCREIIELLSLILSIFIVELIFKLENYIAIKIILSLVLVAFMYLVTVLIYIKFAIEAHFDASKKMPTS